MNQSLPSFSHFTSLLLLCIFPLIVKIEICCCLLSVLPITRNEQALICSLSTSIFVHLIFLSGHGFLPFLVLFTIFSVFSLVTILLPLPLPFQHLHPVLPPMRNSNPDVQHHIQAVSSAMCNLLAAQPLFPQQVNHAWMVASCFS